LVLEETKKDIFQNLEMNVSNKTKICLVPKLSGLGGMVSFQHKLVKGFHLRGIEVSYDLRDDSCDSILVIGGTRQLGKLWQVNKKRIPIIQRLDGMNWLHRLQGSNLRHFFRSEYGNLILRFIRNRLASKIVYQSCFVQDWWNRVSGVTSSPSTVIYNGVDLQVYSPYGSEKPPETHSRLLVVEGNVMGGYEWGLKNAVQLSFAIAAQKNYAYSHLELMIVGRVDHDLQTSWSQKIVDLGYKDQISLTWVGVVPQTKIPGIDRSAHLFYSSDINPACPNSVIEAMGCGVPVIAFDTGALPELIDEKSGKVISFGGDPWKLENPDIPSLAEAAIDIIDHQEGFRKAARQRAEDMFSLDKMVDEYLEFLLD
jgi:glycosyltransferase involved in cell wall biosynthesis